RSRWYESALLLLVTFTFLRPGFWLDLALPRYDMAPPQELIRLAAAAPQGSGLRVRIAGTTIEGKDVKKTVLLPLGEPGSGLQRIRKAGMSVLVTPAGAQIMAVALNSRADKAGFEQGFNVIGIETERLRPAKEWLFVPALLVLGAILMLQRRRGRRAPSAADGPA
ncbi:MAG TPA: DUF3394 domain-containing protein, partial [Ramlibacter sp.]|nr:DUF3394 domain-containing protein [Ramlibacter sp.]